MRLVYNVGLQVGDDDKTFDVDEYDIEFTQSIDQTGKPSSKVKGGVINVTVVIMDNYKRLLQWMLDEKKAYDGSIKLYITDNESDDDSKKDTQVKTIDFKGGVLVRYHEFYSSKDEGAESHLKLTITANEISMDEQDPPFKQNWDSDATT